jgi:hypothetical protein
MNIPQDFISVRCSVDVATQVDRELGCPVLPFPLRYLGLPLGLRKPTAAQLQYLVDAVASRLPSWWASMLNRAGRLKLVRSTLATMSIFAMMSLNVQIVTLLAIEKILRGFLWKGRKDAHGGHYLVVWDKVCMRKELWSRYSKPSEDEPCASGTMALVESSGGFSAMERVRYPSSHDGIGDPRPPR